MSAASTSNINVLFNLPPHILCETFSQIPDLFWKCRMNAVHPSWMKMLKSNKACSASHTLDLQLYSKNSYSITGEETKLQDFTDHLQLIVPAKRFDVKHLFADILPKLKMVKTLILRECCTGSASVQFVTAILKEKDAKFSLKSIVLMGNNYSESSHIINEAMKQTFADLVVESKDTLESITGMLWMLCSDGAMQQVNQCTKLQRVELKIAEYGTNDLLMINPRIAANLKYLKLVTTTFQVLSLIELLKSLAPECEFELHADVDLEELFPRNPDKKSTLLDLWIKKTFPNYHFHFNLIHNFKKGLVRSLITRVVEQTDKDSEHFEIWLSGHFLAGDPETGGLFCAYKMNAPRRKSGIRKMTLNSNN